MSASAKAADRAGDPADGSPSEHEPGSETEETAPGSATATRGERQEPAAEPEGAPAEAPHPRGLILLTLETRWATALFWLSAIGMAATLFIPELLPLVDYPQHVGMAEIAHRLGDPTSPLHEGFEVNYFTYNALFHYLVAQLAHVMPVETAGRLVTGASLVGLAGGTVALLRTVGRPPAYAALLVPVVFSSAVAWGFINYAASVAIGVITLVFVARTILQPGIVSPLVTAALSLLCGFTHVLGTALLCALAVAFAPELAWRATKGATSTAKRLVRGFGRCFVALAPLLAGGLYCTAVYQEQYQWNPASYEDPTLEGTGPPIASRLLYFAPYTAGIHGDDTDQVLVIGAILLFVAIAITSSFARGQENGQPLVLPALVTLGIYLFIPMVFIGTHVIFPRFGQATVFGILFLLPALRAPFAGIVRRLGLALALLTTASLAAHMAWFARETDGLSRVIDAIPPGRKVTAVIHDAGTHAFRGGILIHAAAYYGARTGGEWAFNFARYQSVPLNFKPYTQPGWPAEGWEFFPHDYNPNCWYARVYDVVIVRAPRYMAEGPEKPARKLVFGDDAPHVRTIARDGRHFAFDTKGLSWDGTP